jgi:NADPH:quinone reductase-like Zn-dependent oxidoreductase
VGTVAAVGEGAEAGLVGKRVLVGGWIRDWSDPDNKDKAGYFGSECDGGFAEYTKADSRAIAVIDSPMSDAELATFSCSYVTAEGMLERANTGAGDTVLVPGASGGVGGAVIQLAKLRGARVIAMASEAKHAEVAELGPDLILPRAPQNLRAALGDEKITVVADIVGGSQWGALIDVLERGGRYTCSGAIAGPMVEFDLRTFYLRDLTFTGSTVTSPQTLANVADYIQQGKLKPALAAVYPLQDLREAQAAFIAKKHTGNIVVVP